MYLAPSRGVFCEICGLLLDIRGFVLGGEALLFGCFSRMSPWRDVPAPSETVW